MYEFWNYQILWDDRFGYAMRESVCMSHGLKLFSDSWRPNQMLAQRNHLISIERLNENQNSIQFIAKDRNNYYYY